MNHRFPMPACYQTLNLHHNPINSDFIFPLMSEGINAKYLIYSPEKILNTNIIQVFKERRLNIKFVALFYKKTNVSGLIHSDLLRNDSQWERCICAVNWNLTKASSVMNWWKCTYPEVWPFEIEATKPGIDILNGIHYGRRGNNSYDPHYIQLIESAEITQPTLVRTDIPHNVATGSQKERWCLSIRFEQNFKTWEKALELLRPYFI